MIVGDDPKGLTAKVEHIPLSVFDTLPKNIKPLLNHMVDETC